MFNQLTKLEEVVIQLERITSIFNMMCAIYFEDSEPNEHRLKSGYIDYTNGIEAIRKMVRDERNSLNSMTDKLYKVYWALKESEI